MLGIMGAMPQEVDHLLGAMTGVETATVGGRDYHLGRLDGERVVLAFSRWGKVASASTATTMVDRFGARRLIFTGVAGAADPALGVGDIVVADTLAQHDLDASPLFPPMEVPLLGVSRFDADPAGTERAARAAERFVAQLHRYVAADELAALGIDTPRVRVGLIASGDRFIASAAALADIAARLPGVLCVEMEGAAVAQVAHEHGVPLTVVRVISDSAAEDAHLDFQRFVDRAASRFTAGVVRGMLGEGLA